MSHSLVLETDEKVYYTKLCRLLCDGGTLAVRTVFDGIVSPASLTAKLDDNQPKLLHLKSKKEVLNQDQWNLLYPPSGDNPKSDDFDITLLFVLLRNICGLTRPATGWDALPLPSDTSLAANLVRIKCYRNKVAAHSSKAEVDSSQFSSYWSDISGALVALGLKQDDIDNLKTSPLGEKNYNQLVKEWDLSEQEIKFQLESLTSSLSNVQLSASNIESRTLQIESDVAEIKNTVKPTNNAIDRLYHRDVNDDVDSLCDKYHQNTREWLIDKVKSRVNHEHCDCVVIQAGPGMGKSVVAAKLCQEFKNQGVLGGYHFFKHDISLRNDPRLMLQSVARKLYNVYPKYRDILDKKLYSDFGKDISKLTCKELWTLLFEEPCSELEPDCHYVIVIDALDECRNKSKKDLLTTLQQISTLPSWLRFVLTTRPPPSILSLDSVGYSVVIDPKDSDNTEDLKTYMADKLREQGNITFVQGEDEKQLHELIDMTDGLFLLAYFVIDLLTKTKINSISEAVKQFPKENGVASIYKDYFSRLSKALSPHIHSETGFYDMLEAVVTAEHPIEKTMFYSILGLKEEPRNDTRIEWKDAIDLLHQLFPVENDHVSAFHKTVIDWLTNEDHDHDFNVKGCDCSVLANKCYEVVIALKENVKQTPDQPPSLTDCDAYALAFVCTYIGGSKGFSEVKRTEVENDCYILCLQSLAFYTHDYRMINANDAVSSMLFHINVNYPSDHMSPTFAQILAFTYQTLLMENRNGKNKDLLDYFKESRFPYLERKTVLELHSNCNPLNLNVVVLYNSEVVVMPALNFFTLLRKYQLDDIHVKELSLAGNRRCLCSSCVSDGRLIVLCSESGSTIEIVDVASLEIKATYPSPSAAHSCHVFGCQPWFMVLRCGNSMLYVIDVETGKSVVQPTAIRQDSHIVDVSKEGHILIKTYGLDNVYELSLCSYLAISEKIFLSLDGEQCFFTHFSNDSELLAMYMRNGNDHFIRIVRTSDGSLYRSVSLGHYIYDNRGVGMNGLFVSKERLFVLLRSNEARIVLFIKFDENERHTALEHIFYLGGLYRMRKLGFCKVLVSEDKVSFTTIAYSYADRRNYYPTTIDTYTVVESPSHM